MRMPGLDLLRAVAVAWTLPFHAFLVGGQVLAPLARGEGLHFGEFYLRCVFRILPVCWRCWCSPAPSATAGSAARVPGAGWLAAVSFSLYLVHKPVFVLVDKAIGARLDALPGIVSVVVFASVSVLAAALLHYAVERPFLQLRERWLRRERTWPRVAELA